MIMTTIEGVTDDGSYEHYFNEEKKAWKKVQVLHGSQTRVTDSQCFRLLTLPTLLAWSQLEAGHLVAEINP